MQIVKSLPFGLNAITTGQLDHPIGHLNGETFAFVV